MVWLPGHSCSRGTGDPHAPSSKVDQQGAVGKEVASRFPLLVPGRAGEGNDTDRLKLATCHRLGRVTAAYAPHRGEELPLREGLGQDGVSSIGKLRATESSEITGGHDPPRRHRRRRLR